MNVYSKIYAGDLRLADEEASVDGIVSGDLHVPAGATVRLKGMVSGDVHLASGTLLLDGIVKGSVFNRGGRLQVTGLVGGTIRDLRASA